MTEALNAERHVDSARAEQLVGVEDAAVNRALVTNAINDVPQRTPMMNVMKVVDIK